MKRRELSEDTMGVLNGSLVELLSRFKVGEYWEKPFDISGNPQDTTAMMRYVDRLKQEGLDIGKGDAQFGYRMPLPEKNKSTRYLLIFRRKLESN